MDLGQAHHRCAHAGFRQGPSPFFERLRPALGDLLTAAAEAGEVRADVEPDDLLGAVSSLCMQARTGDPDHARRMVALLVDGLRFGAAAHPNADAGRVRS